MMEGNTLLRLTMMEDRFSRSVEALEIQTPWMRTQ
jgi:hypothetical protein